MMMIPTPISKLRRAILTALLATTPLVAEGAVTFGASVTNANGSLTTTLTWSTSPVAVSCTASGHPTWTGSKPPSGTLTLPAITLSGTYTLTLACLPPAQTTATVSWTAPTTNTDGSALTNLGSFRIYYGVFATPPSSPAALGTVFNVTDPTKRSQTVTALTPGTWYFTMTALNTNGVESIRSNMANTVIVASTPEQSSVTLTVNPVPNTTTGVTVEQP